MARHDQDAAPPSWPRRIAWLLLLWSASVTALALAAGLLRLVMHLIGMGR